MKILNILLDNCRESDRQIGKQIGITGGAVKTRIQKMQKNGVIEKFIGDIPQTISSLKLAVKSSDVTELQNIGHRLRGVAGILNLAKLSTHDSRFHSGCGSPR